MTYNELEKEITEIMIPVAQQRRPNSLTLSAERTKIDKVMLVVKKFIIERLADDARYKE